jgi:hypothetical protein
MVVRIHQGQSSRAPILLSPHELTLPSSPG